MANAVMTDKELKAEAMMHTEIAQEVADEMLSVALRVVRGEGRPEDELIMLGKWAECDRRLACATYLIQALQQGHRPANFDEIIEKARWFDARDEMKHCLQVAKEGKL